MRASPRRSSIRAMRSTVKPWPWGRERWIWWRSSVRSSNVPLQVHEHGGVSVSAGHLCRFAVEVGRGFQPVLVGVPDKHELTVLEFVHHLPRDLRADGGAALAATETTFALLHSGLT